MLDEASAGVEAKISFLGFIEELNRFGRVFLGEYKVSLPKYTRVRFYRNKVIEHWDDYDEYLLSNTGYTYTLGKLIVPFHGGALVTDQTTGAAYQDVVAEFGKFGIAVPALNMSLGFAGYSEQVFLLLEQIDPQLGRKIPDSLVNALFKYSFPVPIQDLDEYVDELVGWIEGVWTTP